MNIAGVNSNPQSAWPSICILIICGVYHQDHQHGCYCDHLKSDHQDGVGLHRGGDSRHNSAPDYGKSSSTRWFRKNHCQCQSRQYQTNYLPFFISWLANLESCHCQKIYIFWSSWLILKICSSLKSSSLCGDSPANPSQFYEVNNFYNFIIYIARSLASLLIIIPWHRFHRSSSLVKSKQATNELLHRL